MSPTARLKEKRVALYLQMWKNEPRIQQPNYEADSSQSVCSQQGRAICISPLILQVDLGIRAHSGLRQNVTKNFFRQMLYVYIAPRACSD